MKTRTKIFILIASTAMAIWTPACQIAVGAASLWFRPATAIAPRVVDKGGGEEIYLEGLRPQGDTMFIVVRILPPGEPRPNTNAGSGLPMLPKSLKEKMPGRR